MEIKVAKSAGFCFGVNRAIEAVYSQIGKKNLYTYGSIIHNKKVTSDLTSKGVKIIENLDEIEEGTVVIRSHGVGKNIYDELEKKGLEYIDGTCPFVKKIHDIVKKDYDNGNSIIIIGNPKHPEVCGINGWCENSAYIVENIEDIEIYSFNPNLLYTVVVQTTFRFSKFQEIYKSLNKKLKNVEVYNTICSATSERQNEAIELSKVVDKMIVIGDKGSSNTQKLYEICKKNCNNTYYIETIYDLVLNIFRTNDRIGITAGASTPSAIIKEVICSMSDLLNNNENLESEEFKAMFEQQALVSLHTGDIVKGTVIQIANEEVSVNLNYKSDGIIPRGEFSSDTSVVPSESVKPGDEIEVFVVRVNDGDGNVLLSRKKVESQKGMEDIEKAYEEKTVVKGMITEVVKGGLISVVNGIRVFIPSSQVSNKYIEDLSSFKGKELEFNIIELELDRGKRRIIGGRKAIVEREANEKRNALFERLEVDTKTTGTVSRITDFGAFIDLGGVDGLIHISEMSWGRISNPREILKEGQTVEVIVLDVDKEKGKISLSLKDANLNPWNFASEKYATGNIVKGKVVRMVPFGAFIELEPGVDGLVHISQIANKHVEKPEDELKIGEVIEVKVLEVNPEQKKISLSRRALEVAKEETTQEVSEEETTQEETTEE